MKVIKEGNHRVNFIHPSGMVYALDIGRGIECLWPLADFEGQEVQKGTLFSSKEYYMDNHTRCSEVTVTGQKDIKIGCQEAITEDKD